MDELKNIFYRLNIEYSEEKLQKLTSYMEEILELNRHVNLTAITDRQELY